MRLVLPLLALVLCTAADWETVGTPAPGPTKVIGFYTGGCIQGAQALPPEGPGYEVIRLSRNRYWAHPATLEFVGRLAEQVRRTSRPGPATLPDRGVRHRQDPSECPASAQ